MANTYDVGDLVRCSGAFTDADGNAQDPATVLVDVRAPSGTTTTYTYGVDAEVVKDDTGAYHIDVDVNAAGPWWYRFYATGSGQSADETYFTAETNF